NGGHRRQFSLAFSGIPCLLVRKVRGRFYFIVGEIGFLADFLFCVLAFGSVAKISVTQRARVFANVPNKGQTKNMTKNNVRWVFYNHLKYLNLLKQFSQLYRINCPSCQMSFYLCQVNSPICRINTQLGE
ncbi:MAG: hypothetical protein JXA68_10630, partial [Ignavibacteriales bacterium]|nr:hypothetical protein [Ignavibacteriales bacterium]